MYLIEKSMKKCAKETKEKSCIYVYFCFSKYSFLIVFEQNHSEQRTVWFELVSFALWHIKPCGLFL